VVAAGACCTGIAAPFSSATTGVKVIAPGGGVEPDDVVDEVTDDEVVDDEVVDDEVVDDVEDAEDVKEPDDTEVGPWMIGGSPPGGGLSTGGTVSAEAELAVTAGTTNPAVAPATMRRRKSWRLNLASPTGSALSVDIFPPLRRASSTTSAKTRSSSAGGSPCRGSVIVSPVRLSSWGRAGPRGSDSIDAAEPAVTITQAAGASSQQR
jgi:hypothetical protein